MQAAPDEVQHAEPSPASQSDAAQPSTSDHESASGEPKKYKQLQMRTFEDMLQEDIFNNCGIKAMISGLGGGALGVAFGLFTASMDSGGGGFESVPVEPNRPTRVVVREILQSMKTKSLSYAKAFAMMGFVYSGVECIVEKRRAKHDILNATYAGCITGGMLAYQAGPKAMCLGCVSFGAFSTAIEHFMNK